MRSPDGHFEARGSAISYPYYATARRGAPVLLLHELPGLTPGALNLKDYLHSKEKFTVYAPLLFGEYGQRAQGFTPIRQARETGRWKLMGCRSPGPIVMDTWNMVDQVSELHPGQSVVVIGNCMTGTLPLDLVAHERVRVAVHCQPALPLGLGTRWPIDQDRLDRSLTAMKLDQRKRLIFIQYVDDYFAPVARTRRILDEIEKKESGLLERVDVVIGARSLSEAQEPFSPLQRKRVRHVQVPKQDCHSTITGSEDHDRDKLRSALRDILNDLE